LKSKRAVSLSSCFCVTPSLPATSSSTARDRSPSGAGDSADGRCWLSHLSDAAFDAAVVGAGGAPALAAWWPQCLVRLCFLRLASFLAPGSGSGTGGGGEPATPRAKLRRAEVVDKLCEDLKLLEARAARGAAPPHFRHHETMTVFTAAMVHFALASDAAEAKAEARAQARGVEAGKSVEVGEAEHAAVQDEERARASSEALAAAAGALTGREDSLPVSASAGAALSAEARALEVASAAFSVVGGGFAEFSAKHRALLDPRFYRTYYSDAVMSNSPSARISFELPDLQPLPNLVST
jgi:hypothetical protein